MRMKYIPKSSTVGLGQESAEADELRRAIAFMGGSGVISPGMSSRDVILTNYLGVYYKIDDGYWYKINQSGGYVQILPHDKLKVQDEDEDEIDVLSLEKAIAIEREVDTSDLTKELQEEFIAQYRSFMDGSTRPTESCVVTSPSEINK